MVEYKFKKKSGVLFPISPFFISKNNIEVSFRNLHATHPCPKTGRTRPTPTKPTEPNRTRPNVTEPTERDRTRPNATERDRTQLNQPDATEPTRRPTLPGNQQPHPEPTSRTGSPRSESNPPHRNRPRPPQPGTIYPARNRALPAPESARTGPSPTEPERAKDGSARRGRGRSCARARQGRRNDR